MNDADKLRALLGPPPTDSSPPIDWQAIESALGTQLPSDYRQLIDCYGPGAYLDGFQIFGPCTKNRNLDLLTLFKLWRATELEVRNVSDGADGLTVFPDRGGLLLWGNSVAGNPLCWNCQGEPDEWKVAFADRGTSEQWHTDLNLIDFLESLLDKNVYELFEGTYHPDFLPRYMPVEPARKPD